MLLRSVRDGGRRLCGRRAVRRVRGCLRCCVLEKEREGDSGAMLGRRSARLERGRVGDCRIYVKAWGWLGLGSRRRWASAMAREKAELGRADTKPNWSFSDWSRLVVAIDSAIHKYPLM